MNTVLALIAAAVIHVPETAEGLKAQLPANADSFNHIRLVNVANAVPAKDWPLVTAFPASRLNISIALGEAADAKEVDSLLASRDALAKKFGPKARLFVFIEDSDATWPVIASPASFCRVNIRPLKADKPDAQTLRDRIAKQILRGINYAAGGGSSADPRSVTYTRAATLADLDKAMITISPDAYFPLLECLTAVGGDEMTAFIHSVE